MWSRGSFRPEDLRFSAPPLPRENDPNLVLFCFVSKKCHVKKIPYFGSCFNVSIWMCEMGRLAPKQRTKTKPMESHLRSKVRKVRWFLWSPLLLQKGTVPEGLLSGKKKSHRFRCAKGFSKECLVKVDDINPGFNKDWNSNTKNRIRHQKQQGKRLVRFFGLW